MTIAIVQSAGYVFPLVNPSMGDPDPGPNITLANPLTSGNLLIACIPNNYQDELDGITINPYWSLFLEPTSEVITFTWLFHIVGSGETASLPPFLNGWTYPFPTNAGYNGGVVYELSGASTDLSDVQNTFIGMSSSPSPDGFPSITASPITTTVPNSLTLCFATAETAGFSAPPPWCGTLLISPAVSDAYAHPGLTAENLQDRDYNAGHAFLADPSTVTYEATFPNINSVLSGLSIIVLVPASSPAPTSGAFLELSVATVNWTRPWTE